VTGAMTRGGASVASVQKHKNRWRVKWHVDGRARYESFSTKREAEQAARKIEGRTLLDGKPPDAVDANTLTLARWWARWEPGRQWRHGTRETHAWHWRKYIAPVFGNAAVKDITTADVRRFHRVLEQRGLAPGTVSAIHRTLSMVLGGAVEDGFIGRNPAAAARLRRPAKHAPVAFDAATVTRFLDAVQSTTPALELYARLIAATGLRRGEAAGLTWDRVDLDAGELVVDRQLDINAASQPAWTTTKTGGSRRVPLTAAMVQQLRAHLGSQTVVPLDRSTALVFTQPNGRPWTPSTLEKAWHRAADKLAENGTPLPEGARGWHVLRHSVASRLVESGVPPAEAAAMLGHTPEMLLRTYSHVVDRKAADERLRAALDG
jgi:integrase